MRGPRRELSTGTRGLFGLAATAVVFAAVWVGVTFSYGGYDDHYQLVGDFPRAGQGLANGSDVTYRGVDVGEVSSVELVDRQARVTLNMDPGFEVPEDASFVVRPKTIFGEKFVDVTFPNGEDGPFLEDGDVVADAEAATEVEDFFEGSDDLFDALDEQELAELFSTLNEAARGTGQDVAAAFESGADATALGADTIDQQLRALSSWSEFQDAISGIGGDLNTIAANSEVALTEFNENRAAYERVLTTLRPFAEDLAALLIGTRPDIDTYLERGDSVVRLLTANEDHLTELIEGLGQYVQAFGGGLSQERLPDGSGFAYFKNFIYADDVEVFLCTALAEAPGEFAGLRDAILSLQTEIDCSGYFEPSAAAGAGATPAPPMPDAGPARGRRGPPGEPALRPARPASGCPRPGPRRPARRPPRPRGGPRREAPGPTLRARLARRGQGAAEARHLHRLLPARARLADLPGRQHRLLPGAHRLRGRVGRRHRPAGERRGEDRRRRGGLGHRDRHRAGPRRRLLRGRPGHRAPGQHPGRGPVAQRARPEVPLPVPGR